MENSLPPKKEKLALLSDTSRQQTEYRPFNQLWVNSCYQQTLLPNAPWHKLEEEISHSLAQKVEKQFNQPQRKEMLLEVLGKHFVDKYLSHVQRNPEMLEPIHISAKEKNRLKIDAQNWLNSQMYKAVKETGHGYLLTGIGPGEPPPTGSYADFLQETFNIFTVGIDRELYLQEKKILKSSGFEIITSKKVGDPDIYKVPAPSRMKEITTADYGASKGVSLPPAGHNVKARTEQIDPPPLWGPQSDTIGAAVVSLLQRDPRKFEVVANHLHGRQLPGSLRAYMWADILFKAERKKNREVFVEKLVRERFGIAVTRGLTELRINKPTQSPINGLIQNAVVETYSKTTSMVPYKHMLHLKETVRALNVLYVYDRSYEPYLIYWLFPIQLAFRNKEAMADDKGEHVLELAMYLDMLNCNCFPTWPHVFAMAEQVMMRLQSDDPQLYDHLKRIAPINALVNPKEFLLQLLHQEREKAEALLQMMSTNTPRAPSSSTQFLADPTIFLRRWIGEGFVSVLDTPGVMYIWDQLFMQNWSQSAIINVCLSLMELLRHQFMEAYDYITMKEVFLMEPCKLYTVDFQMAWIHVENGKDLIDINTQFNRQRPISASSPMSEGLTDRESPDIGILKPCGIKNMRTSLTIPSSSLLKESWLADLHPQDLRLNVTVYFGSVKLRSRLSYSLSVITAKSKDSYGSLLLDIEFPEERHIYDMLDISQFDVERELGAYPYAIFKLEHLKTTSGRKSGPVSLGWCRLPLYRQSSHRDSQGFSLQEGDVTVALHPGDTPESFISAQPQTPSREDRVEGSLLGYSCTFSAYVFDPNNEPTSRKVKPFEPEPELPPLVPPLDTRSNKPAAAKVPTARKETTPPPAPAAAKVAPLPEPSGDPWVPSKPGAAKSDPKPTTNRDPFVLFIDSVRHLPDSATIVKVTGRILRAGNVTNLQDILAVPNLDSPCRSPTFNFNMVINQNGQVADPELLLFLRVSTYDLESKKVAMVGSALVRVFNPGKKKGEGLLNVGGHQLRLYSGMPATKEGLSQISPTDLDKNPVVPGCSLLIRLLPYKENPVPAPSYSSGYYKSESCKPTVSESRLFATYQSENRTSLRTEKDMIIRLQQFENNTNTGGSDIQLKNWLLEKLDIKKHQGVTELASNLALNQCIRYRVKIGLKIDIKSAYGLPDGCYVHCFARIIPGRQAKYMTPTEEGYGKEEKFITTKLVPTSHLTAPIWEEEPKELHPFCDSNTCLIVQLIGFKVLYKPQPDHKAAGTVHKTDGTALEITDRELIGWAVLPLFDVDAVISGSHIAPILTKSLNEQLLEDLSNRSVVQALSKTVWNNSTKIPGASIKVNVWDAHFNFSELPEPQVHRPLLDIVGNSEQYLQTVKAAAGSKTHQEYLLDMLDEKTKKQGVQGPTFKKEMTFFTESMTRKYNELMVDYCLKNGLAPL
ncbi:hypothetical protein Btru_036992 [Bulinus truncatus]|nr:hypothetical protein Btru_036992 [Bulinus truncatus]